MLATFGTACALNSTGSAEPTVSSRDFLLPFSGATCSTAKSYGAPAPPVGPPLAIHWSEVCAQSLHQTPNGATVSRGAPLSCAAGLPALL